MQPGQSTTPNSIVHPSNSPTGGGVTVVGGGSARTGGDLSIRVGIWAVLLGLLLPVIGIILACITIAKGVRQSRKILLLMGIVAVVTTVVGVFIYVQIYRSITHKANTSTSQVAPQSTEESDPDGFDSLGVK